VHARARVGHLEKKHGYEEQFYEMSGTATIRYFFYWKTTIVGNDSFFGGGGQRIVALRT